MAPTHIISIIDNYYAWPPYCRTKIYAARMSFAVDDAHRRLHVSAAAARAASGTERRTDIRTDTVPF